MNLGSMTDFFAHFVNGFQLDDSSTALIALLGGMVGGWRMAAWHQQLKAKRAKIQAKTPGATRKMD